MNAEVPPTRFLREVRISPISSSTCSNKLFEMLLTVSGRGLKIAFCSQPIMDVETTHNEEHRSTSYCRTTNFHKRLIFGNCNFSWFANSNFCKLGPSSDQHNYEKAFRKDKFS